MQDFCKSLTVRTKDVDGYGDPGSRGHVSFVTLWNFRHGNKQIH